MKNILLTKQIIWDSNLNLQYHTTYPILLSLKQIIIDIWNELCKYRNKMREQPDIPKAQVEATLDTIKVAYRKIGINISQCVIVDQLDTCDNYIKQFEQLYRHKAYTTLLWKQSLNKRKCFSNAII